MNIPLFLEIKNEYTEHLVDTLTPFIYEGINSIYREAVKTADEANAQDKILLIFQKLLQSVAGWNQLRIDGETSRIKHASNTTDYLDDLIKAVIKSNIILLSYSNTISNIVGQTFYNNFSTSTFIHRSYTECAKDAHNNPYLFYHDVTPMDLKRNQIIVNRNIQNGIVRAIRKILPISMILKEFLVNSINIVQEQQKIELVGSNNNRSCPTKSDKDISAKLSTKLEKEIIGSIKADDLKSEQQKIKAIIGIDKLISATEHMKVGEISENIQDDISLIPQYNNGIYPKLSDRNIESARLGTTDNKIINIDFDDEKTVDTMSKKSMSLQETSLSSNKQYITKHRSRNYEATEKIDPNNVDFIEDYGITQSVGKYNGVNKLL